MESTGLPDTDSVARDTQCRVLLKQSFAHTVPHSRACPNCALTGRRGSNVKGQSNDPTQPVTTFRIAWTKVCDKAKVVGRWHDNRHTLVTELAESGAGDEVIMSIEVHVSRAMLSRYSHVRMEAKRRALDEIAARQRAADEKRKADAERQQAAMASRLSVVQ